MDNKTSTELKRYSTQELAEELFLRAVDRDDHAAYGVIVDEYVDVAYQNYTSSAYGPDDDMRKEIWRAMEDAHDRLDEYAWEIVSEAIETATER